MINYKFLFSFLFLCWVSTITSQNEKFINQSSDFVKSIINKTNTNQYLDNKLKIDSVSDIIEKLSLFYENKRINTEIYIIKVNRKTPLFNINVYNNVTKESYGDFRILFTDTNDYLIDKWMFLEPKKTKNKYDFLKGVPAPPSPN